MPAHRQFRIAGPLTVSAIAFVALLASPAHAQQAYPLPAMGGGGAYGAGFGTAHGQRIETHPEILPEGVLPYSDEQAYGGEGMGIGLPPLPDTQSARFAYSAQEREEWIRECARRYGEDDDAVAGAIIGGVVGGIAGNRIAGRGNRAVGTVAGAAVGAVAGAAIDRAGDRSRARTVCEDYLVRYEAGYEAGPGYSQGYSYNYDYRTPIGQGYVYSGQHVWVPMVVGWNCKPKKKEVVEEWIEERPARRVIPAPTKRVPISTKPVPVKTQPTKAQPVKQQSVKTRPVK